jgi:hypothetical protein
VDVLRKQAPPLPEEWQPKNVESLMTPLWTLESPPETENQIACPSLAVSEILENRASRTAKQSEFIADREVRQPETGVVQSENEKETRKARRGSGNGLDETRERAQGREKPIADGFSQRPLYRGTMK